MKYLKRLLLGLLILGTLAVALLMASCATLTPYEEVRNEFPPSELIAIDGQAVHVQVSGAGEPLILLHGFAASTYSFHKLVPMLESRFRVVAIDLNGFGYTERPGEIEAFGPEGQLEMVQKVMEKLEIQSAHFIGHSYGGLLSLLLAGMEPSKVEKLILISPATESAGEMPGWFQNPIGRNLAYGAVRLGLSEPARFRGFLENAYHKDSVLTDEVVENYRQRLLVEGLGRTFRSFAKLMAESADVELEFDTIRQPTLVIAGKHDAIVPLKQSEALVVEMENAQLVVMEQSGHSSPEEQPEEVALAILRFLDR